MAARQRKDRPPARCRLTGGTVTRYCPKERNWHVGHQQIGQNPRRGEFQNFKGHAEGLKCNPLDHWQSMKPSNGTSCWAASREPEQDSGGSILDSANVPPLPYLPSERADIVQP